MCAVLLSPERTTLTNLICLGGNSQADWSHNYRLYSEERVKPQIFFEKILHETSKALDENAPLVVAIDDTIVRKSGKHIPGVGWRRDPLGPHFQTNLVSAQRFLQMSAAWPLKDGQARLVPVRFEHAPTAPKPSKDATEEDLAKHKEEKKQKTLNTYALETMNALWEKRGTRKVIFTGDGSYTNGTILKGRPAGSTYIGRIRKDATFYQKPTPGVEPSARGRHRSYGELASTPEALRQDKNVPWQSVEAFAAGKCHEFEVKVLKNVLWRKSGSKQLLSVMVIRPLGYHPRKGSKTLYRQPAYLICTDPELPIKEFLQYYLWRWGIEVNFREEKAILGVGDAQVRTEPSNRLLPATLVASYGLMWVCALKSLKNDETLVSGLIAPRWRASQEGERSCPSTGQLQRTLRSEYWSGSLRASNFYHFTSRLTPEQKCEKMSMSVTGLFQTA
jgi:hypothetical protein